MKKRKSAEAIFMSKGQMQTITRRAAAAKKRKVGANDAFDVSVGTALNRMAKAKYAETTYLGQTYKELYRSHGHLPTKDLSPQMRTIFDLRLIPPDLDGAVSDHGKKFSTSPKLSISAEDARILSLALSWTIFKWDNEAQFAARAPASRIDPYDHKANQNIARVLEHRLKRLRAAVDNLNALLEVPAESTEDNFEWVEKET